MGFHLATTLQTSRSSSFKTDMENIADLLPAPKVTVPKRERYKSSHDPAYKVDSGSTSFTTSGSRGKKGTMGPAGGSKPNPQRFQRKGAGHQDLPGNVNKFNRPADVKKPSVPLRTEHGICGLKNEEKNYVTANAVENILSVPRSKKSQDPNYLKKVDYAKVPAYLSEVKAEIDRETQYIRKLQHARDQQPATSAFMLNDTVRANLVSQLKQKWATKNRNYIKSTSTNCASQVKKKEELEAQLSMLEKYITKLSKRNITVDIDVPGDMVDFGLLEAV